MSAPSEAVTRQGIAMQMLREAPASSDGGVGRAQSILELHRCIRGGARIAFAVGLLACLGLQGLWGSTSAAPGGLSVQRSTRAIPHRYTVYPSSATIAVHQTQRFGVTDSHGKSVAVRWNVSGIGCSGAACGTVDANGVYRTPSSLPQPRIVTLEAVLVSNPNYSVLAEIRLEDTVTVPVGPTSAQVSGGKSQPISAPVVGRQNVASRAELPPLPAVVAAAPGIARRDVASNSASLPLPTPVATAPALGTREVASISASLPLSNPVSAAPALGSRDVASGSATMPLPNPVAVAPALGKRDVVISFGSLPLPNPVATAPALGRREVASISASLPLSNPVAAPPAVGRREVASRAVSLSLLPQTVAVAAAPEIGKRNVASGAAFPPLPVAAAPVAGSQNIASGTALPPPPDTVATAHAGPAVPTQPGSVWVRPPLPVQAERSSSGSAPAAAGAPRDTAVVTYRDGQLTINAENLTLAAVLTLVAEKTGAVIDVPPGTGLEHIVEHAGPGRAEDVLVSLLNGSPFDYVIVGSPQHPHDPAQVLLSLRGADTPANLPLQVAADATTSASAQPASTGYLWTPPAASPSSPSGSAYLWTSPGATSAPTVAQPLVTGAPTQPIPPDVLEQMMKTYSRQLRGQPPQ